jgi:hypothetical protein
MNARTVKENSGGTVVSRAKQENSEVAMEI